MVLCSRQQALERCKSKYSVVCSSLNTAVWPAGRRFRARERASRLTEITVSGLPEAAEEALATTDACVEGAQ